MNKVVSGRYRILGIIGTGGMAVVYRAWDEIKKCEVALKMNVRVEMTTPSGKTEEIFNDTVNADEHMDLEMKSEEEGVHVVSVYFDGELHESENVEFK